MRDLWQAFAEELSLLIGVLLTKPADDEASSVCRFVAPIYNYLPVLTLPLQAQTYENWELLIIHDGANAGGLSAFLDSLNDPRIRFYQTDERHTYDDVQAVGRVVVNRSKRAA